MPIVSVCARRRPEWGSLPFGNRWACDITSPPPPPAPIPPSFTFLCQTNERAGRAGHMRIPPSLGYHGNEHWSRQHLAVVRREGEKAGGEAERDEGRGEKGEGEQIVAAGIPFQSSSLCLSSVCTVSTLPLLSPSISSITAEWVEIWCSPLSTGFVSLIRRMPLKISEMTSRIIPLLCRECVQLALP